MSRRVLAWWWTVLTAVLAAGYLIVAAVSPLPYIRWPAVAGALLVGAGLWYAARNKRIALVAIVVGALIPVVTTWWSVIVPLTAALIILCGVVAVRAALNRAAPASRIAQ